MIRICSEGSQFEFHDDTSNERVKTLYELSCHDGMIGIEKNVCRPSGVTTTLVYLAASGYAEVVGE